MNTKTYLADNKKLYGSDGGLEKAAKLSLCANNSTSLLIYVGRAVDPRS